MPVDRGEGQEYRGVDWYISCFESQSIEFNQSIGEACRRTQSSSWFAYTDCCHGSLTCWDLKSRRRTATRHGELGQPKLIITDLELRRDDDMVCAGGSSSDDLLQSLEEYLPVLLGLVEDVIFGLFIIFV